MDTTYNLLSQYDSLAATVDVNSPAIFYVARGTTTTERLSEARAPVTPPRIKTLSTAAIYKRQVARSRQGDLVEGCLLGIFCWMHPLLGVLVSIAAA
jgi:hypothetical protein